MSQAQPASVSPSGSPLSKMPHKISFFSLAMINVAAVFTLRNAPAQADYGFALVFYLICGAVFFFIPSALVSAELASAYPQRGGVYLWVKRAFGPEWGFVAIFMQWIENVPYFPVVFAFAATAIAYVVDPALAENKLFVVAVMWAGIWVGTFMNFRGMKTSAFLSSTGVISGTIVPGIIIVVMAVAYLVSGKPVAIEISVDAFFPDLGSLNQLMLLTGTLLAFAGMEMSAVHVTEIDNPRKRFPQATFMSAAVILILSLLTSLAIAIVVPPAEISFSAGVMEAFRDFFDIYHMDWATQVLGVLLAYGAFTMAVTWMIGPPKGLLEVARDGYLPKSWQKRNKVKIPTGILYWQGAFSSVVCLAIFVAPTVSSAFWLMSALALQLYLVMYLFMFAAAIRLRYKEPDKDRPYKVPGGNVGMWITSGLAWLTSLFVIAFGFIPPQSVRNEGSGAMIRYVAFLAVGIVVFVIVPLVFFKLSKKHPEWRTAKVPIELQTEDDDDE
jgi:glutamate:GABA antiporter